MLPLLVLAVLVVGFTWLTIGVTVGLIGLLLMLFVAGLVGWAADLVIPGRVPGGWLGAILVGIVGGFVGRLILGNMGPVLFGVHLIPAFVGALIIVALVELVNGREGRYAR